MSQRGSVRRRGASWTAYWNVRAADGSLRQRTKGGFRTRREAQAHLTTVLGDLASGTYIEPKKVTLAQFVETEWLPSLGGRPNTVASYTDVTAGYWLPRLGGHLLAELTPSAIQRVATELAVSGRRRGGGGLSPQTVRYALTVLQMALDHAVRHGFLARNPARSVARPGGRRTEMRTWSAAEANRFLASVRDHRLYVLFLLALTRGPRRGELAGLRWSDVDLAAGRIAIVHTRVSVGGQAQTSIPKTEKGRRTIPLDVDLTAALREHRRRQLEERLAFGEAWTDSGYVFTREDGVALHPEYLSSAFERLVAAAGLPRIRFHDCRHTAATLSLQAGVPTKVVSEWLGHASTGITEDLYRHAIPSMQEEAGAFLTRLILDATEEGEAK